MALREIAADKVTPANIRQLEDMKALPETASRAKEDATRREVEETFEAETQIEVAQFDASGGFDEEEPYIEQDEE